MNVWSFRKELGRGINLGNTLEAPHEGAWAAKAEPCFFEDYYAAGFRNVRIPICWEPQLNDEGIINASFLARVSEVVDVALNAKLCVIINCHHEGWMLRDFWGQFWKLEKLWQQLSKTFEGYPQSLLFEIFNEPRDSMGTRECDHMNTHILSIVREKHPERIVIIGGAGWGSPEGLMEIEVPSDSFLMAQFHYYAPHSFTHDAQGSWGEKHDYDELWVRLNNAVQWAYHKNIPLYCGEFGAKIFCDPPSREKYYQAVAHALSHYQIPFSVWDDAGDFGLYDRQSREFHPSLKQLF